MKKIYILFMAGALALGAISCSKDDNSSTTTPTPGGTTPPPVTIDVWAKSVGKYSGKVTNGQGENPDMTVTVTKLSETKLKLTPGAENTLMQEVEINVFKNETSLYHQQGTLDGTFKIIADANPPQLIYTQNSGNISFFGLKQ
jgi:hypothetical protein